MFDLLRVKVLSLFSGLLRASDTLGLFCASKAVPGHGGGMEISGCISEGTEGKLWAASRVHGPPTIPLWLGDFVPTLLHGCGSRVLLQVQLVLTGQRHNREVCVKIVLNPCWGKIQEKKSRVTLLVRGLAPLCCLMWRRI